MVETTPLGSGTTVGGAPVADPVAVPVVEIITKVKLGLVNVNNPDDEVLPLPPPAPTPVVGLGKTDTLVTIGGISTVEEGGSGPIVVESATDELTGLQEKPTAVLVALLTMVVKL